MTNKGQTAMHMDYANELSPIEVTDLIEAENIVCDLRVAVCDESPDAWTTLYNAHNYLRAQRIGYKYRALKH